MDRQKIKHLEDRIKYLEEANSDLKMTRTSYLPKLWEPIACLHLLERYKCTTNSSLSSSSEEEEKKNKTKKLKRHSDTHGRSRNQEALENLVDRKSEIKADEEEKGLCAERQEDDQRKKPRRKDTPGNSPPHIPRVRLMKTEKKMIHLKD
ncbi:hypothetical protein PAMA_008871 [Pampus argenteus]